MLARWLQLSAVSLPDPLPPGYELDSYVIELELPATGIGRVYRAVHSRLKGVVAVVVLGVGLRHEAGRHRLMRAVASASLAHQPIYDFAEYLGVPYVVVGYRDGVGPLVDVSGWASS